MRIVFVILLLAAVTAVSTAQEYPTGDLNRDFLVDLDDLTIFAEQWLDDSGCTPPGCAEIDSLSGVTMSDYYLLALHWLEDATHLPLAINEFMASNNSDSGIADPQGQYEDWIEIYNYGDTAIDLAGMYLTDDLDNPTAWQFPAGRTAETTIASGGYLVVWVDGDILDTPGLHAGFSLNAAGEEIGFFEADGVKQIDAITFSDQVPNLSYGRSPDGSQDWRFFPNPTPGTANGGAYLGLVADTQFSHTRGFYDAPFALSITSATPGARIYYTTNGSAPIENGVPTASGILYSGPISISATTCIRAAAIKTGWMPTNIDTQTYIFNASTAMKAMPLISIVGDAQNSLYEPYGVMAIVGGTYVDGVWQSGGAGTYNNPMQRGQAYERPVSFEWIDLGTGAALQEDCGIRVHGSDYTRPRYTRGEDWVTCWNGWPNWNSNKFSFNLWFRSDYGCSRLEGPFFPFIDVDRFESIALRAGHNDACAPFVKDEWARRLFREMGHAQVTGRFANLYINGVYRGFYNPTARGDMEFYQEWYGTDEEFDVITQAGVRDGDSMAWDNLLSYANGHNLSNMADYEYVASRLDIPSFIDMLILQIYIGNFDWPGNNWDLHRRRTDGGKLTFSIWDAEGLAETWAFGNNGETMSKTAFEDFPSWTSPTGLNNLSWDPIAQLYRALRASAEFRQLFADHVHRYFRNGGVLTKPHLLAKWWEVFGEVSGVLPETINFPVQYVPNTFIPNRESYVLTAFANNNLFSTTFGYPIFNINGVYQHGGYVSSGATLTITQSTTSGTLYYTTDGSDPRAGSQTGSELVLVPEAAPKKVIVPSGPLTGGTGSISCEYWTGISGTSVANLTSHPNYPDNPSSTSSLTSFEIPVNAMDNYGTRVRGYLNPPSSGTYKFWIASDDSSELRLSTTADPANAVRIAYVNGWTNSREWTKYAEQASANISLTSGQRYYIEALQKEGGGGDNLAVSWSGPGLSQQVIAGSYLSPFGVGWTMINYNDTSWTSGFGGVGYENNPTDPVNYSNLINTDVKTAMHNVNATCCIRIPFTISAEDLAAITQLSLNIRYDDGFIAYLNGTKVAEDFADSTPDWDSASTGQRDDSLCVSVRSIDISNYIGKLVSGSNVLSIHGMNVSSGSSDFLITAGLVAFKTNSGSVAPTAIEYTGGISLTQSTPIKSRIRSSGGQWSPLNEAVFAVGPVAQNLRITELMYHPENPDDEFMELMNVGDAAINLNLVRLTKGVDYTFGPETLAPGERILVVCNQASFLQRYPSFTGRIAGQYEGKLDNGGELIRLRDALDAVIQEFTYKDDWYPITDGDGFSLTIRDPAAADLGLWNIKDGWRPSAAVGGSPGSGDEGLLPDPGSVVINELLAHSHSSAPDWIELHNTAAAPIHIGGWFLSDAAGDEASIKKYEIPLGTSIPAGGYVVFYEDQHFNNPQAEGVHTPFSLSEGGETVYLRSGLNGVVGGYEASETFGASQSNVAFGRHIKSALDGGVNFVAMSTNTPGSANAYPMVGPVVISEIMYNPSSSNTGGEYLELHNITGSPVTLQDEVSTETSPGNTITEVIPWKFSDGIDFTFPANTTIPAYGYLILAGNPSAFTAYYGPMPSGVAVLGPFENGTALSNGGEQVQIVRPGDQEYGKDRYWIRTERVTYDDVAPWPTSPDGGGDCLRQKTPDTAGANYGNDVINWQAAAPNPGR
jgi:hypothetical protein